MNFGLKLIEGVLFGIGLIIASVLMKALLKVGFCG